MKHIGLLVFALLMAAPAFAHRAGIPITSVEWNARTGYWEITHQMSVHDVDAHFKGEAASPAFYESEAGIAEIGNYVSGAFIVSGRRVQLNYLGAELDCDQVFVYFEMKAPDQSLRVDSDLLMGAGATEFAHVNVKGPKGVRSYVFGPEDGAKTVELKRPKR